MTHVLDQLYTTVLERKNTPPSEENPSRTARLFTKGVDEIAKKLGEEAVETVIEGVKGNKALLIEESADLLYHLIVLWAARSVDPSEVWGELEGRFTLSEAEERALRKKTKAANSQERTES